MNNQILNLPRWMKKIYTSSKKLQVKIMPVVGSMQSVENNVCLSSTSETHWSVQAINSLCHTANSLIVKLTSTLLNDLFAADLQRIVSFFFQTM